MVGTKAEFDSILELCGDDHRRIVLGTLLEQRRTLTMRDLSEAIVEYNHHAPLQAVSGELMTEIRIELHHVHVPKLEAAGLVEYDSERDLVEPTAEFDRVAAQVKAVLEAGPALDALLET